MEKSAISTPLEWPCVEYSKTRPQRLAANDLATSKSSVVDCILIMYIYI